MTDQPTSLESELKALHSELAQLNGSRFLRMQGSFPRMITYQLVRGLAFGLGSVVGATILVSVLVLFLSKVNFIPVFGDWATEISEYMKRPR